MEILTGLSDDLALAGFAAQSIAVLKRIQSLDPGRPEIEEKLAYMITQQSRPAPDPWAVRQQTLRRPTPEFGMEEIGAEEMSLEPHPVEARAEAEAAPAQAAAEEEEFDLSPEGVRDELQALIEDVFSPPPSGTAPGSFVLAAGMARAFVKSPGGRSVQVRELMEGDFFGEISILTGRLRSATITAASRCELLELDRATLDSIAATHPHVRDVLKEFHDQRSGSTLEAAIRAMGSAKA